MKNDQEQNDDDSRRIHYIPEWAERRNLSQADIVRETGADKSLVHRWFKGTLPTKEYLDKLADLFAIDRGALFRPPDEDWLYRFFRDKTEEQKETAIRLLKAFLNEEAPDTKKKTQKQPKKPPKNRT